MNDAVLSTGRSSAATTRSMRPSPRERRTRTYTTIPAATHAGPAYRAAGCVAIAITQSGETADTIAALLEAKSLGARTLTICNAPGSQATRAAEAALITRAGPEIGVASTKAFTTQLTVLTLLALHIAKRRGSANTETLEGLLSGLRELPGLIERVQSRESQIESLAIASHRDRNALYLGRGALTRISIGVMTRLGGHRHVIAERDRFCRAVLPRFVAELPGVAPDVIEASLVGTVDMMMGVLISELYRPATDARRRAARDMLVRVVRSELARLRGLASKAASAALRSTQRTA